MMVTAQDKKKIGQGRKLRTRPDVIENEQKVKGNSQGSVCLIWFPPSPGI